MYKLYTDASVNQPRKSKFIYSNFEIKSAMENNFFNHLKQKVII